jgi:nucleoside-triphosphatase THEP1
MSKTATKKGHSVQLNVEEAKNFLGHIIDNNRFLQKSGKSLVSTEVVGDSGLGKTSIVLQLAQEKGLSFVKLNLAQIEELGDLVGFPIRQFEMSNGTATKWVDEHAVEDHSKRMGFYTTGANRMSYCPPEWIAGRETGGVLLLDDWNRADIRFIQAVMELIDRQQYISWTLPKDWHIILTSNPDNGEYLVNSIDNAQKTRFVSINLKFDVECWGRWAEKNSIDSRCINFLLMHPEIIKNEVNARSITTFFNAISSLDSFENDLSLIQMIGEGSVGPDVATMFTLFINNKLDKIISPDKILLQDETYVLGTLKSIIGTKDKYRADIASTIATRVTNYVLYFAETNNIEKKIIERLSKIVTSEIFNTDICYNMVKQIYNGNTSKFKLMAMDKGLVKYIMK